MKKYEIINKGYESQSIKFYKKIFYSLIIFGFVVTLCKISPDTGSYVKKVLTSSYDFNYIKVKTSEFLNNIKDYINFEEIFVWGE